VGFAFIACLTAFGQAALLRDLLPIGTRFLSGSQNLRISPLGVDCRWLVFLSAHLLELADIRALTLYSLVSQSSRVLAVAVSMLSFA